MGINDTRRAPSDLNIDPSMPEEDLDIITAKGQDYTQAIEGETRKTKTMSMIPEAIGGIVSDTLETDRQIDAIDFNVGAEKRQIDDNMMLDRVKRLEELSLANQQYDTYAQMSSEMELAREQAINNGTSVKEALDAVSAKYADAYDDSTRGQERWSSIYNPAAIQGTKEGLNTDYQIQQAKAEHNLLTVQNTSFQSIVEGKADIDTAYSNMIAQSFNLSKNMSRNDFINSMDSGYNNLVVAKAMYLNGTLNGNNGEQVSAAIKDLIKTNGRKDFTLLDSAGQPIKDGKGTVQKMTASLTPETIQSLLQYAHKAESSVSSAGAAGASGVIKDYKEYVGYGDLEKTGVSDYLMSVDPMSAKHDYDVAVNSVMSSDMTPKAKAQSLQQISDTYYETVQPIVAATHAMQLTPNSQVNRRKLLAGMNAIKTRLNSGQSMTDFSYTFDMDNGGTFTLKPELNKMNGYNPEITSKNAWTQIYNSLQKATGSSSNSDFAFRTNKHYNASMGAAIDSAGRLNVVQTNTRGDSWTSPQGISDLTTYLKASKNYLHDAAGNSSAYSSVPLAFLEKVSNEYTNTPNKKQQIDYIRGVATALKAAGYSDFVLSPQTAGKFKDKQALNALMTEMYLSAPGLSGARAAITSYAQKGGGSLTAEAAHQFMKESGYNYNVTTEANKLIAKYNVPAEYQESLRETLRNVAVSYASQSIDAKAHVPFTSSMLEHVVKSNFVKLPTSYLKNSVYVGSPILAGKDPKQLANSIEDAGMNINNMLKMAGIDTTKYPIAMKANNSNGYVNVSVGGRDLSLVETKYTQGLMPIGVPFAAPKPKNMTEDTWNKTLTQFVTAGAVLTYASDPRYSKGMADKFNVNVVGNRTDNFKQDLTHLNRDSVRIMKVMQSDGFLSDYKNYVEAGSLKSGTNPAPAYIKKLFAANAYDRYTAPSPEMDKMLDYAYSRATAYNKINTVTNRQLSNQTKNYNYADVLTAAHTNGFSISRGYDATNVPGVTKSAHNVGRALDFGVQSNNMLNKVTGRLDITAMTNFTNMISKNQSFGSNVQYILTSRPELLDNKPEYAAYAKFRAMKSASGAPLFKDARKIDTGLLTRNHHDNHFHVQFKNPVVGPKGGLVTAGYKALANDLVATQTDVYNPVNNRTAAALVGTFAGNYGSLTDKNKTFGIANLSKREYNNLGVPDSLLDDPVIQTRVLGNRFQAYSNALGSDDLAIFALAGGRFKSSEDNKVYDIRDIISKGLYANDSRNYTLAKEATRRNGPGAAEQARLNSIYKKYKRIYKNEGA